MILLRIQKCGAILKDKYKDSDHASRRRDA
jgi:hypothetical protein